MTLSCLVSAVEEVGAADLMTLGPNPVDDVLHIQLNAAAAGERIEITDAAGRMVAQVTAKAGDLVVDTTPLAGGLYVASLRDDDGRSLTRARFVKQ